MANHHPSVPPQDDDQSPIQTDAVIVYLPGQDAPFTFIGKDTITLGRSNPAGPTASDADLLVDHGAYLGVSQKHALIHRTKSGYYIQDLDSTNGTWLDGKQLIPHQSYGLRSGAEVRLGGQFLFVYFSFGDKKTTHTIYLKDRTRTGTAMLRVGLTVPYLLDNIGPYLQAIADIQQILDDAAHQPFEVVIQNVGMPKRGSWIEASIRGASQAIEAIHRNLPELSVVAEKDTTEMVGVTSWPGRKDEGAIAPVKKPPHSFLAIARDMISSVAPDLIGDELYELAAQLRPYLEFIASSDLEIIM
jgi:pSer/pThr/pTyr-binding forkhead associated (FHA) protein